MANKTITTEELFSLDNIETTTPVENDNLISTEDLFKLGKVTSSTIDPTTASDTELESDDGSSELPDNRGWFEQAMDAGAVNADLYDNADAIFDINNTEDARNLTDSELQAYIDLIGKSKQSASEMEELNKFTKAFEKYNQQGENWFTSTMMAIKENGGVTGGGMKGFAQASIQSFRSMANTELLKESAAPTLTAAGGGAVAGAPGGPLGVLGGGLTAGSTAFFTSMNYGLETINTFNTLLEEEIANNPEKYKDGFTPESIRMVMADDEARVRIRKQARKRGATIATIEGVTNLVGIKGSGAILKAGKGVTSKVGKLGVKTAAGTTAVGTEIIGGGTGEYLGEKVIGRDASGVEIVLESMAMAPFTAAKDVGIATINQAVNRPSYQVDGTKVSKQAVEDYVNGAETAEEIANLNVKIDNDDAFAKVIHNKIVNTQLETQVNEKIEDPADRQKMVDLERQRIKAEADTKKKGIQAVPGAKETLESIEMQMDEIVNKYSNIDGRTSDVRARKKKGQQVDEILVDKEFKSNLEFAKKHSKLFNLTIKDDLTTEQIKKQYGQESADALGFINEKTNEIIINSDVAKKRVSGKNVGNHELLHGIINVKWKGLELEQRTKLASELLESIGQENKAIVDARIKANYDDAYMKDNPDEYITVLSDAIANNEVKFNDNVFTKVKDYARNLFQALGFANVDFETSQGIYNFLKDYNKSIHKGALASSVAKAVAGDVDIKTRKLSKEASDKVQSIYDKQGEAGAMDIIDAFKPITNKLVQRRSEAPNFDRQLLTDEIETGKRGIFDLIREYKPESGVPLAAYINKFLPARAIEASQRVLGEEFTQDVTEAKSVAAEETTGVEVKAKPVKKKIVLSERLGITKKVDDAVRKIVPDLDIENLTFKSLKNKIPNVTSDLFGIAPKKIESLANLTKKELQSAQMFINKNADLLINMLPEGATPSGTATGVPNTLLKAFYTKADRAKMAKTGSKSGLAIQQKNNIKKTDFLETFGIIDGKPVRTDRNTSARVLALANLTGKMITNQAVRTEIAKTKANAKSIKKIAEGKSETMFSKDVREFNIGGTIDNLLGTHKDKVGRKTYKLKTKDDVDVYMQALIDDVLSLMPRDFWFGTPDVNGNYGSEFTTSSRVVDNKEIYEYYKKEIKALRNLPDKAFGKEFGVSDYSRPTYKSLFEGKKGVQVDKIKSTNKRTAKIHEVLWSRIYDAIQKDPTKAAAIGNYFKLVSKQNNHWHRAAAEIVGYSKNPKGDGKKTYEYEHAMPATASYLYLLDAALKGYDFKTTYNPVMDNFKLIALDAAENKKLNKAGLGRAMPEGWNTIDNKWWERYFNDKVDIDPESITTLEGKTFKEEFNIVQLKTDLKDNIKFSKVVNKARTASEPKGITVLDFDDTLATTKSLVKYTTPDGTTGTLNAEEFASTYEDLQDQGYVFDFSDFNKVVKGKLAPLFNKAMKLQGKFGPENMFVLTARPPQAAKAIFDFLKANGLNIPLKNITGLGNSTSEAKALWIADKVSEGFNDFYFADDALQNVQAVKNMLDQFDVKSKVQQAKVKFSKDIDGDFNKILEEVTGIEAKKRFSDIKARKRGESKGKFRVFIPPSHEDFVGLLYNFMGKGRRGDQHRNFFEQALVRPLNRAYREIDAAKQAIANDYKSLNKQFPDVNEKLTKKTPDGDFTFQDAIRVYLWNKHGHSISGLSPTDQQNLVDIVMNDSSLQAYAETLNVISKQDTYVDPGPNWETGNIRIDLVDATGRVGRASYFTEFNENAEIIFSPENLNKIEAGYGKGVREALEDMLHRVKTGVNRPKGSSAKPNVFMNWLNASVSGVMFFNTRSALLQQMSNVNYLNFADNNIYAAGKAFANQPQYWKDFAMIFNSDMLKQRRGGLQTDINGAELAEAIKKARPGNMFDQVSIITGKALRLGFLPTQIGDNIAIATGGAAFYRNRVNKYIKDNMSVKEAEAAAFTDFQNITQSTQQSARPDMTSQQQASWVGKLILNFLNTPSQYNRIIKKAGLDIINRRITGPNTTQMQSDMSNMSRILYYGAAQNLIFYGLQTALFAVMFGLEDEDEEKKAEQILKKKERVIQGSIDTILRGSGIYGVAISTIKNMVRKFLEQREKGYNKDESAVIMEMLNFSPVVGIKARKIVNAEKTLNYNKKVIKEMETFDIDNPQWSAVTNYVEAVTTAPVNRLYQKTINLRNAADNDYTALQRALFFSGYTTWSLNLGDTQKMKDIKKSIKNKKKTKRKKTPAEIMQERRIKFQQRR